MIESPLLLAMHHIVGSIQVQHDALRRFRPAFYEQVHQQVIQFIEVRRDTLVAAAFFSSDNSSRLSVLELASA